MSIMNPKHLPAYILCFAVSTVGLTAVASSHRIRQSVGEMSDSAIAAQRAEVCRVLGENNPVVLGHYYFQPSEMTPDGQHVTGQYLPEGTYICDLYGVTARIERGGYAQFLVRGSQDEINKILKRRLEDKANPDHNPLSRPLDARIPPNQGAIEPEQKQFFELLGV